MNEVSLNNLYIWLLDHKPSYGFPANMKIKYNDTTKEILGFAYETPNWARKKKMTLKLAVTFLRKNIRPNDNRKTLQALENCSIALNIIATYLAHLPQFRSTWDAQFPTRKKPIIFKDKIGKLMRSIDVDKAHELFIAHGYDVKKRIEKLLGFQLIQDPFTNQWWPHFMFTKMISTFKNKPIYTYVLTEQLKKVAFEYESRWYDVNCAVEVFDANRTTRQRIPNFFKNRFHTCKHCLSIFHRKVPMQYNNQLDARCCPTCHEVLTNYKQPQWNIENIYHPNYHSNRSGWQFTVCRLEHEDSIPIGLELETEFMTHKFNRSRQHLAYELWQALGKKDIIFERDGSLNDSGIECITNPMTAEYARVYWGNARKELEELTNGIYSGVPGYNQEFPTTGWGAHMTFARKYWSDVALAKFTNFTTNSDHNQDFMQIIAQRLVNWQGGSIGGKMNNKKSTNQFPYNKNAKGPGEKIIGGSRANSVNLSKQKLVEIRMFQSVNTYLELMKNYDFITAMHVWLMNYPVSFQPTAKEFVDWLCEKGETERHKRFKYLIKYLQLPVFRIRDNAGGNNRIIYRENTYRKVADTVKFPSTIKF